MHIHEPCSKWVQATLEEVCEADLLLHVLDASSPDVQQQRSAVLQVNCTYLHCPMQLRADIILQSSTLLRETGSTHVVN